MRLQDKVIVVTAATRGIGAAIVKACAQEGATVYIGARNMERAQNEVDEMTAAGFAVKCVYNDASKPDSYQSMIDTVVAAEGRIDGLVNNFGGTNPAEDKDLLSTSYESFLAGVDANVGSVFLGCQAAAREMTKTGGGSIVNISSIAGSVPDISQLAYGTAKAAINHMTKSMAVQLARANIRVNAVAPGMTATDAVADNLSEEFKQFFLRHIPLGRMADPAHIAAAVVYFLGDESAATTGQLIEVAGGFGLATPIYADAMDAAVAR